MGGGLTFTLGLVLVLVGGAELFTGNNLIVMAWASGKVSTGTMLRNWAVVYAGNLLGSLGLVVLVFLSHHLDMNDGRVGMSVLNTAAGKIRPDVTTLFVKGLLCNVLVCAAVWLAYAGRSVTDKIVAVILPISAFVAAGFEHCVANMYFLPLAWLLVRDRARSGWFRRLLYHTRWHGPQPRSGHARQYRRWRWPGRRCLLGHLSVSVWRGVSGREVTGLSFIFRAVASFAQSRSRKCGRTDHRLG